MTVDLQTLIVLKKKCNRTKLFNDYNIPITDFQCFLLIDFWDQIEFR